jgi:hypothetical protein
MTVRFESNPSLTVGAPIVGAQIGAPSVSERVSGSTGATWLVARRAVQ